jgi:hypothetical protein
MRKDKQFSMAVYRVSGECAQRGALFKIFFATIDSGKLVPMLNGVKREGEQGGKAYRSLGSLFYSTGIVRNSRHDLSLPRTSA